MDERGYTLAALLVFFSAGCGSTSHLKSDEMDDLKLQVTELQKVVSQLTTQVEQLQSKLTKGGGDGSVPFEVIHEGPIPGEGVDQEARKKSDPDESVSAETSVAQSTPPNSANVGSSGKGLPLTKITEPSAVDQWSPVQLFQTAYNLRQTDTPQATQLFARVVKTHPESPVADGALFWLGMIQSSQGATQRALVFWDKILRDYPNGSRVPDALYQMAVAYRRMQQIEKARLALDKLKRDYAHSEAATLAQAIVLPAANVVPTNAEAAQ